VCLWLIASLRPDVLAFSQVSRLSTKKVSMCVEEVPEFKIWKFSLLLLFLLALPGVSLAANHYVWCGASGGNTGADFTNAYTDLPSSLTRGDTYYVAGSSSCSYGAHKFNDALSGTSVISILHATASANSGVAGWQSSFGTTPAEWLTTSGSPARWFWTINQGYYTFDGEFGSVGTTEPTSGTFGFYFHQSGDNVAFIILDCLSSPTSVSHIVLNYIEADGSPLNFNNLSNGAGVIQTNPEASANYSTVSMTENYFHDMETGFLQLHSVNNWTVDHTWSARSMSSPTVHGNGVAINPATGESSSNLTFSDDTFQDVCGTSVITSMNGTVSNLVVYGSTFFQTKNTTIYPGSTAPVYCNGDGQIGDLGTSGAVTTGVTIYNNTFYNGSTSGASGVYFFNPSASNIVQTNNLFVNENNLYLTTTGAGDSEDHNTVINSPRGYLFTCSGTGDSCQGTDIALRSASVTSNVADVVTASAHGLSVGSPVLLLGSQVNSTNTCGIDTYYPYPTVSNVKSSTEFQYTVQQTVPNATCQAGVGYLFPSPVAQPFSSLSGNTFTLSSDTVDPHLNDGTTLSAPYNIDPLGVTRGSNGNWDRGAYQFLSSQAPVAPTGLTAIVQ
jgi:hypothetical protein